MDKAALPGKWFHSCLLILPGSRTSVPTALCSSLARSKSPWRLCRCTICSDGQRSLELQLWSVGPSLAIPMIVDWGLLDLLDTIEHAHRQSSK